MSNISTVTAALKAFIEANVYVGSLDLDPPRHWQSTIAPGKFDSTLTALPASELVYQKYDTNSVNGVGKFRFQLKYRLPAQLSFDELGISDFERLAQYLQIHPMISFGGSSTDGITSIQPSQIDYPIVVEREDPEQSDWTIYVNIEYLVEFSVTEYDLPDQFAIADPDAVPGIVINSIALKVYNSEIGDLDDNVLDYEYDISQPE